MQKAVSNHSDRMALMQAFLHDAGVGHYDVQPLGADASFRSYMRLFHATEDPSQLIVMNAPPEHEDVRPFLHVGRWLSRQGFSAPNVLAADEAQGFLLLEDLGDDLYARLLEREPEQEEPLYIAACDLLKKLHGLDRLALPRYNQATFMRELSLFTEWWMPAVNPEFDDHDGFLALWPTLLEQASEDVPSCVVLRDYHAENILWLPERGDEQRVGLLDFQDALIGPVTYDLVSLLEDARRDVSPAVVGACLSHVQQSWGIEREALSWSYAIMGAQRNLKILGIFMRLSKRDDKPHYEALLPRVYEHLMHDLTHPALAEVNAWVQQHVPRDWKQRLTK